MSAVKELYVLLNGQRIGVLSQDNHGRHAFQYDTAVQQGTPLSVYVQCFLSRLGSVFPQFGLLVSRSVGAVWAGGAYEEGIGPPNLYIPGL